MAEFMGDNEEYISAREPIVFENKTECKFEVCAGVVFHKSGVYEVSVAGNRTIVSEVSKRKPGKWIDGICCSECGWVNEVESGFIGSTKCFNFCPNCGVDMRGEQE